MNRTLDFTLFAFFFCYSYCTTYLSFPYPTKHILEFFYFLRYFKLGPLVPSLCSAFSYLHEKNRRPYNSQ